MKHDVSSTKPEVHNISHLPSETVRATTTGNMGRKFGEISTCGFQDMREDTDADRQTNKQTNRRADRNISHARTPTVDKMTIRSRIS